MTVNIDGLNIEYITEGEGQPVLLLHGWGSSFDVYRGIINTLKNRCREFPRLRRVGHYGYSMELRRLLPFCS